MKPIESIIPALKKLIIIIEHPSPFMNVSTIYALIFS